MQKNKITIELKYTVKVETAKIIKVKAHTRICNGKKVKVRSHYRQL